jgi:hypothetical protein
MKNLLGHFNEQVGGENILKPIIGNESLHRDSNDLVWFSLVYLFIHSVTHVTLDTSITVYNLYITTQLIIYGSSPNII